MIVYPIGMSGQQLVFSTGVLAHLKRHRQTRWWQREAGGQLFARLTDSEILIDDITGPRRTDWRTRCSYRPHRAAEQREIDARHRAGFHFVGDWHTHPEPVPVPSSRDMSSIAEMVIQSHHALHGFVLVIVGQLEPPAGLFAGVCDGRQLLPLAPAIGFSLP